MSGPASDHRRCDGGSPTAGDHSDITDRIERLAAAAQEDRSAFEPPADPPDAEAAHRYLLEGVGPAVAVYVEARTGEGSPVAFAPAEFTQLEAAMNTWFELYAACYGESIEAAFTVREAAELLLETHDLRDVAVLLTGVPDRDREQAWSVES